MTNTLSTRDFFAGMALMGLLAGMCETRKEPMIAMDKDEALSFAYTAYDLARFMLQARAETMKGE